MSRPSIKTGDPWLTIFSNISFEETLTRGIGLISAGWLFKSRSGALEGCDSISPMPENSQPGRYRNGRDDAARLKLLIDRVYDPLVPLERTNKSVSVHKASNGDRAKQLGQNKPQRGRIVHLDRTKEIVTRAHVQNDPMEKHVAPPPRMTICPFCGDTMDDPTISGLGISWPSSASERGIPPRTCIL